MRLTKLALALCWAAAPLMADVAAITSQGAERLSLLDAANGQLLREITLPGQPAAVAIGPTGQIATVSAGSKVVWLFSPQGDLRHQTQLPGAPFGVAFDPQSGNLWVTDAAGAGTVQELSGQDLRPLRRLTAAANPTGLDRDDRGWMVVAARDADLALAYPPDCGACTPFHIRVGHHPFGVTIHEGRAYVTNVLSDDLSVIDLDQTPPREIARIPTGERPYALAFAAGRGFVTNQYAASVTVFDPQSLTITTTLEVEDYPEGIAAGPEGTILLVHWMSDSLLIYDAQTLELRAQSPLPSGPRALGRFVSPSQGAKTALP